MYILYVLLRYLPPPTNAYIYIYTYTHLFTAPEPLWRSKWLLGPARLGLLWRCQCPRNGRPCWLCFHQCAQQDCSSPLRCRQCVQSGCSRITISKMPVSVTLCSEPLYSALLYLCMDMHGFTLYIATRSSVKRHTRIFDEPGH